MLPSLRHPQGEDPDLQQQGEPRSIPVAAESRAKVLIMEGDTPTARMIAATLAKLYRVTTASDGQEGIEQALVLHPDLILCDVSMPRVSGEQLVKTLRKHPDFDDVPILAISEQQLHIRLLRAGAQDYLEKPFNREELRVRVANLLMIRQARRVLQREVTQQSENLADLANEVVAGKRESEQLLLALQEALHRSQANYAQLERTKSQLRAIIDASQEAMLFLSPGGRPLRVNARFSNFFRLDDTTVLSQSAKQLTALLKGLFEVSDSLDRSLDWNTADQEHIFREKQVQVKPMRREFDFSSLPVINADQTYIGRLYVWHDVTREREIDRMKSEFVSMASHELRTPLTSIKGYIDLLLTDDTVGELNELQREFLGITQYNTRRLTSLVNDLLDLTSMESGKLELHYEPINITLLIRELLPSFQPGWDTRRQTFTLHAPEPAPIVLGDADRVRQILSNLLSNAHKYTQDGGHIGLSVEIVGHVARVAITDSGIGLSSEEQAQLFTRFYRAHNAITGVGGGTGLGLVITRSLVEMQGGEIQVSSEPGHGSTFRFTLPLACSPVP